VLLRKLRQFQELGHKVIFLIGDATGLVGDPSGQQQARRLLTWDEVRANATTYADQVNSILRTDRQLFEVRYNSEWFLGRSPQNRTQGLELFDFTKWVQLASKYTVARLMERDDFSKRLKAGKPLSLLELFYPLMQGYDSVKIAQQYGSCDVEVGGTDQTFNLLVGRELLHAYGFEPQAVLTMPLLEGLDGVHKMSKSLGNQIGLNESATDMFGKLMNIPDELIVKYLTLLTDVEAARLADITDQLAKRLVNPRDAKADLAADVVARYHGSAAAVQARQEFTRVFSERQAPTEMPTVRLEASLMADGAVKVVDLLVAAKLAESRNDARRLIQQKGVKLNDAVVAAPTVPLATALGAVLKVGRHFRKLVAP